MEIFSEFRYRLDYCDERERWTLNGRLATQNQLMLKIRSVARRAVNHFRCSLYRGTRRPLKKWQLIYCRICWRTFQFIQHSRARVKSKTLSLAAAPSNFISSAFKSNLQTRRRSFCVRLTNSRDTKLRLGSDRFATFTLRVSRRLSTLSDW